MAAFVPKTYTNGKRTEVANSAAEESNLRWAGWWLVGTYTPTPRDAFSHDQLEALKTAFVRSDLYNVRPRQLARYQAARAAGTCRIACVGDSETAGTGTANPAASSWPRLLADALGASGTAVLAYQNPSDPRINPGAAWAPFAADPVPEPFPLMSSTGPGVLTFTSATPGTVVEFGYLANSPAFTVSVDGGAPVTPPFGGSLVPTSYAITGLPNKAHTVTITASEAAVHLTWLEVHNGTGVRVLNAGIGGSRAAGWVGATPYQARPIVQAWNPDLVVLTLGANDGFAGRTADEFTADLATLVAYWRSGGADVALGAPVQMEGTPWTTYRPALRSLAEQLDVPLLDFGAALGPYTLAANPAGLMFDTVHPNEAGYAILGALAAAALA